VGHGLQSHIAEAQTVRVTHPTNGYPVVFVDTPGFDDTLKLDVDILIKITDWLRKSCVNSIKCLVPTLIA
jgi:hypothetical protein